jgi:Ca2+/Na+ antiporter
MTTLIFTYVISSLSNNQCLHFFLFYFQIVAVFSIHFQILFWCTFIWGITSFCFVMYIYIYVRTYIHTYTQISTQKQQTCLWQTSLITAMPLFSWTFHCLSLNLHFEYRGQVIRTSVKWMNERNDNSESGGKKQVTSTRRYSLNKGMFQDTICTLD